MYGPGKIRFHLPSKNFDTRDLMIPRFRHTGTGRMVKDAAIDPIHKGVSLFLPYTNMNKMNGLHHVKEHP